MPGRLKIAIAGYGPAGLAAALQLHRDGHYVTLVERFDKPAPVGSGLMLQPTGRCVLRSLGLDETMASLGKPIHAIDGRDIENGRKVLDVDLTLVRHELKPLAVHRGALFGVLHDAVLAEGIRVLTGTTVCAVARFANGQVRLVSDGETLPDGYDLIVDATGARSPLQDLSVAPMSRRPLPFGALWASLDSEVDGFTPNVLHQRYRRADRMIGVLPVGKTEPGGRQQVTFFWSIKPGDVESWRDQGLDVWQQTVLSMWPETAPLLGLITDAEQLTFAGYTHHTMTSPWGSRVIFIGDAAHTTSPQLGQGANMALLDAHALAAAVRAVSGIDGIGPHYAALRRWNLRAYQWMSALFTPFYQSDSRLLPLVRDAGFQAVIRLPFGKALFASLVGGLMPSPLKRLGL
jgi:2-polyprenyl-6-methoxyphenol hydroxylase-like FAD-dependent oxidoreductase